MASGYMKTLQGKVLPVMINQLFFDNNMFFASYAKSDYTLNRIRNHKIMYTNLNYQYNIIPA